ncbi:MAG: carboxypeptidase-like regulatory domain-containing protein, partial [Chitinophagaceae bacterium]
MKHLYIITIIFISAITFAQTKTPAPEKYLQISGVVLDDSLQPLPFVSVMLKGTRSGTVSDFYGFFTIVARPGDEMQFFSVNHKSKSYNLADTLTGKHYSIIQILTKDTIQLEQVNV